MRDFFGLVLIGFVLLAAGCAFAPAASSPGLPTRMATAVPLDSPTRPPLPTLTPTATSPPPPTLTPVPTDTPVIAVATATTTVATATATSTATAVTTTITVEAETATVFPTTLPAAPISTPVHGVTTTVGFSVQERPITAYQFNNGPNHVVFVGGIHGGYEWNTILLAYDAIDYFLANPEAVPDSVTLHIIPSANPDGQFLATNETGRFFSSDVITDTVAGRFNANGVDLNRNWDCEWSPSAVWRDQRVSGGSRPFSEPETVALRDFLLVREPVAVIFWHSAANGVYAAGCPNTHAASFELAQVYGEAAGYPINERFNAYPITGDAGDWLTTQGIATITVELRNHRSLDWPQNLAGVLAVLDHYALP